MPSVLRLADIRLKTLCIENICRHMDSLWCADFLKTYYKKGHWRYVIGPFDSLLPQLIEEIFLHMKVKGLLRRHHCYLLLSVYAKKANFSACGSDLNLMLQLTMERSYALQQLDISSCKSVPKQHLNELLAVIPTITYLNFAHTNVDDSVLSQIGRSLPKLKILDLKETNITDEGLQCLVLPVSLTQEFDERFGKCQDLVTLKLEGCLMVSVGTLQLMLLQLPGLAFLDHSATGVAVQKLIDNDLQLSTVASKHGKYKSEAEPDPSRKKFKLKAVNCSYLEPLAEKEMLTKVAAACPQLKYLHIVVGENLEQNSANGLLEANDLIELQVGNEYEQEPIPFDDYFGPFLQKFSSTMTTLNLSILRNVDLFTIRTSLPNLRSLSLIWNRSYIDTPPSKQLEDNYFTRLKTVKIYVDGPDNVPQTVYDIPYHDLFCMLICPTIESLSLVSTCCLNDNMMADIFCSHTFPQLKHLELSGCNELSFQALSPILDVENKLEVVHLLQCYKITKRDIDDYKHKLKKLKWIVDLKWS